jgi:carboxylesterase type B
LSYYTTYRLGALGFLASSELLEEGEHGNAAFLDQRAAYDWVKKHIHKFGGDGSKITIMYIVLSAAALVLKADTRIAGARVVAHKLFYRS